MRPRLRAGLGPLGRTLGLLVLLVVGLVVGLGSATAWAAPPEPALRFGGGSKTGGFTATATALGQVLADQNAEIRVEVEHTGGSCDNVRKLARGELDVALVQYDVAAEAFSAAAIARETQAGSKAGSEAEAATSGWMCGLTAAELDGVELQLVASVYDSAVHVLVRRPVRLDDFSTIGDRPIYVGKEGSGSMETSKVLLGAAGLSIDDVNYQSMGTSESMAKMRAGELLLMLRTTGVGDTDISDLLASGAADLNPLPPSVITRLIDGFPYYRVCQIDARSYPGLDFATPTVCVSTVVLTAKRDGVAALDDAEVSALITGLRQLEDNPPDSLSTEIELSWHGFAEREPVPLHPEAERRDHDTEAAAPGQVRFGAGSAKGGFTATADALDHALGELGVDMQFDVRHTGGSCDNVRKLARGELEAALVQYDVAAEAFEAAAAFEATATGEAAPTDAKHESGWMCGLTDAELEGVNLQLIAAINDAAVHMLVRRPVRLDDFAAIGHRPIYIGKQGSGSMETSKVILGAAGLTLDDVNARDIGTSASMEEMRRGEILMMLRTTGIGDAQLSELIATGMADLNALPGEMIERLIDGFPYYRVCQIDAHSYPGLEFGVPTVCVSSVVLTASRDGEAALRDEQVASLIEGLRWIEDNPQDDERVALEVRFRGFAEREPVPLHPGAAAVERWGFLLRWAKILALVALALGGLALLRRFLRRKGILGNPLSGNLEGQLSNPIVPFVGFLLIVGAATLIVWSLEHDSNARVRTLNDSFWEMNMFATGNFDSESLKTSTARVIGAAATIAGLGLLAWFTAALTSILSQDQMRLFRRLRNHIVILNFNEDMIQLIRVLRSPGPQRQRSIHVVVNDALPPRVRHQLTRVRGLTIYEQNPEVPEELVDLRLPRAARVIVLQGSYHPLRIARAVHHACVRLDPKARAQTMKRAELGLAPSVQSPALAGDASVSDAAVPVTLVEAGDEVHAEGLYDPFARWLMPVPSQSLADAWLANACLNPVFGEFFNDIVTFRDDNSELYTVLLPASLHGKTWRELRRLLLTAEGRAGIVPIGLYRGHRGKLAYAQDDVEGSSPQAELARRLHVNPALDLTVQAGDRLLAFAEDEADLRKVLKTRG